MSNPSNALLRELFDLLCKDLRKRLENGEQVVAGDEVVTIDCKPATLAVIRQFLRDNDIQGIPATGTELEKLTKALPDNFGDSEDADEFAESPSDSLH